MALRSEDRGCRLGLADGPAMAAKYDGGAFAGRHHRGHGPPLRHCGDRGRSITICRRIVEALHGELRR
jgi:hypothetical protein